MKHIVYKITNLINNKYYIGVHSTNNIYDNYMGSGNLIKDAIKKYGVSVFIKEILYIYDTRKEALNKEYELVNIKIINDINCYNIAIGGGGCPINIEQKYNKEKYYNFELINSFDPDCKLEFQEKLNKLIKPDDVLKSLSKLYNYKDTHIKAKKYIYNTVLHTSGFYNNIVCNIISWENAKEFNYIR